jgi:ABC-type Mn2+/Zn2+ transport system permease subunit
MDITWSERFDLFGYAIAASLLAGLVCPLVGSFLLARRTSFYGVALPQFATAGVVFGFLVLPWWVDHIGLAGLSIDEALQNSHAALNYHLGWAGFFTFGGLLALMIVARKGTSEIGWVAAAFSIAVAATSIFGRLSFVGQAFVDELVKGEVLGVGRHELETIAVAFLAILVLLILFRRDLVLASFDREFARTLRRPMLATEALLAVLTGATVSVGTMILGPTLLFGMLVLPPLAARPLARSMSSFLALAAVVGEISAMLGILASFELDLPMGAAIAAAAAVLLLPSSILAKKRA